jgi:hypothetical protein
MVPRQDDYPTNKEVISWLKEWFGILEFPATFAIMELPDESIEAIAA